MLQSVIDISHSDNQPILATGQMVDMVFSNYKKLAHDEAKAKFDKSLEEKEAKWKDEK